MNIHALDALIRARYLKLPPRQQFRVLIFAVVLFLILTFLLVKGCSVGAKKTAYAPLVVRQGNQIKIPLHSPLRERIKLKPVGTLTLPHNVSFPGNVEADPSRTINVIPPLTGRLNLMVSLGDFVKKNQSLAIISSPELAQAHSDYEMARAQFKLSQEALVRAKKVNQLGANSLKDVEQAQNNYSQASAELKRTEERLKILGQNTSTQLTIKAPIEGRITALNYGQGSYVTDTTVPLLILANLDAIWVTANIPENFAGAVYKNQRAVVYLLNNPEHILHGKIAFVSPSLDPETRRNKTRISFPNKKGNLQVNMFATVSISIPQPSQLIVPITSVLMNNDTTSVYVEISPWVFERREVKLGLEDAGNVRVTSGLDLGEKVVIAGGIFLND